MRNDKYILDGKIPVPEPDLFKWGRWLEENNRSVADEMIGHYRVSTVFLGLDHSFSNEGPPLLFETMIFDNAKTEHLKIFDRDVHPDVGYQERTSTWELALEQHAAACAYARTLLD